MKSELSDFMDKMRKEAQELRKQNEAWNIETNKIFKLRNEAIAEDKAGNNQKAIELYLQNIDECEKSQFNNKETSIIYAIDRIIILFAKEKNKNALIEYLEHIIIKYSTYKNVPTWIERLDKLKKKSKII